MAVAPQGGTRTSDRDMPDRCDRPDPRGPSRLDGDTVSLLPLSKAQLPPAPRGALCSPHAVRQAGSPLPGLGGDCAGLWRAPEEGSIMERPAGPGRPNCTNPGRSWSPLRSLGKQDAQWGQDTDWTVKLEPRWTLESEPRVGRGLCSRPAPLGPLPGSPGRWRDGHGQDPWMSTPGPSLVSHGEGTSSVTAPGQGPARAREGNRADLWRDSVGVWTP